MSGGTELFNDPVHTDAFAVKPRHQYRGATNKDAYPHDETES